MSVSLEPVSYASVVLHALKYPSKGVCGLLIGTKEGKNIKVTSVVPVSHETSPLAPVLELALTIVTSRGSNIIGAYFANPNYQDKSLNSYAARLAERIASVNGSSPLLVQINNWQLSPDCSSNCLSAHIKEGDTWKEAKLDAEPTSLLMLSRAMEQKIHRSIFDFDNHLDRPECDFFNNDVNAQLQEIIGSI